MATQAIPVNTPTNTVVEATPVSSAVTTIPTPSAEDIALGRNLCPNDLNASRMLEDAMATLRTLALTKPEEIIKAQATLYNILARWIIKTDINVAFQFLNNILAYMAQNLEGHFSSKRKFRGFDKLDSLNSAQRSEFIALLFVLIDTADPITRVATARSMSWEVIRSESVPSTSNILIDRLQRFYNVN